MWAVYQYAFEIKFSYYRNQIQQFPIKKCCVVYYINHFYNCYSFNYDSIDILSHK